MVLVGSRVEITCNWFWLDLDALLIVGKMSAYAGNKIRLSIVIEVVSNEEL